MEFKEGMKCLICESGTLSPKEKALEFEYKDNKTVIPGRQMFECDLCGESFLNKKDEKELELLLSDARRQIDGLLTSSEIRRIRAKFGMTQTQFAKALRVGEKNFARYETGMAVQGYAMDNLLRSLDHTPKVMESFYQDPEKVVSIFEIKAKIKRKNKSEASAIVGDVECSMDG